MAFLWPLADHSIPLLANSSRRLFGSLTYVNYTCLDKAPARLQSFELLFTLCMLSTISDVPRSLSEAG